MGRNGSAIPSSLCKFGTVPKMCKTFLIGFRVTQVSNSSPPMDAATRATHLKKPQMLQKPPAQ